jgi:hypothetical protein
MKPWPKVRLTYIQTVEKKRKYFHPCGCVGRWPTEPPNYSGFRYYGRLQSIHHVESWEVVRNFHLHFPESPSWEEKEPHFLYKLGPPIRPLHDVKSGKVVRGIRVWPMRCTGAPGSCSMIPPSPARWESSTMTRGERRIAEDRLRV